PADAPGGGKAGTAALWPHRRTGLSPAGPDVAGAVGSDIGSLIAAMKRETFAAVFVALCAVTAVTTLTLRGPGSPPSPDEGPTAAPSARPGHRGSGPGLVSTEPPDRRVLRD